MKLYRAANDDYVSADSCSFAETREVAEAYLNNPGFGGSRLWVAEVEIDEDDLLDLTDDSLERLQDAIGSDAWDGALGIDEIVPRVAGRLCEAGYQWVRVSESFPCDTITWIYVGGVMGDEPELEEVR